ncbi:hypothetical protein CRM22_001546 [Opisthorchis felineus]|uniref:Uncharacterized protein n=1 Tax=Opisthorchis felineus TaxID=147828 RepID=A0A4S2MGL0_OPIFE|nr:hypothetical protein CRM22_001546 [Opisthorchis felineus]
MLNFKSLLPPSMTTAERQSSAETGPTCTGSGKLIHIFGLKSEALTVRLAPEKDYCAIGQCDGRLLLLPIPNKRNKCLRLELQADEALPCTDLAFIPRRSEFRRLVSVYASGFIRIWQFYDTGKVSLWKSWRETEVKPDGEGDDNGVTQYNQILCLGLSPDNKRFVTGGSDTIIRVYDIPGRSNGRLLIPSIRTDNTVAQNFHTNRVTSLVYHPRGAKDVALAHIFFSASWDGTVQGWDDRTCGSLWLCAGTNVAGSDGLCVDPVRNLLISGSFKHDKVLSQVWQARTSDDSENRNPMNTDKPLSTIWQDSNSPPVQIYVVRATPGNEFLVFGGTNCNMIKLIQSATMRQLASVTNLPVGVYSADTCVDAIDKKRFLISFTNGKRVYLLLVDPRHPNFSETP